MKKKLLAIAALAALSTAAGPARAAMIAGWDHNQLIAGFLSVDGATLVDTFAATYSDFDPTFGAGAESAAFGTLYLNGQFGSSVTPLDGSDPYVSTSGSLASNVGAPQDGTPAGDQPFGSNTVLTDEGVAPFASEIKMVALGDTSVVYSADLSSLVGLVGSDWSLSFAGQTASGTSNLGIEFSTDGIDYTPVTNLVLNTVDSTYEVLLGAAASTTAYVRLALSTANGSPFIDNLAISATVSEIVPEPGTILLIGSGLFGLTVVGRRRA